MKNFYVLDTYQNATITNADTYKTTSATVKLMNECNKSNFGDDKRFVIVNKFVEIKK